MTSHQGPCWQPSRREFCRVALSAATAGCLVSSARAEGEGEKSYPAGKFVDMHVHFGQKWNERGELSPEMMLRWMDANDIAQAVVLPLVSPEAWFYPITPGWVLEQTAAHRDRLIPFCVVDPRSIAFGGHDNFVDLLKRYVDAGAIGFGEHKWGGAMDDPRNITLFKACAEVKLPVLFHMDNLRNTDTPGLPGLEKVLQEVPEVDFIGHGPGWWASISAEVTQAELGGYPRGEVVPGGAIDRLMEKYPNLYGELSAGSGANSIRRDMKFGREFLIRRADRIMFGTDYLALDQNIPQFALFEELDLPEEVEAKVFRDNARRVLKL